MSAETLWVESYQGEVLGETLFGALAAKRSDPDERRMLEVLTLLERSTKDLAEPIFTARGWERGDTAGTIAAATAIADALVETPWAEFVGSFEPVTSKFLATYRELVALSSDDTERAIAEAYVSHELALAAFARRELGQEPGDSTELILALPHVAAASAPA